MIIVFYNFDSLWQAKSPLFCFCKNVFCSSISLEFILQTLDKVKIEFHNYILRLVYLSVFYKVHKKLVLLKMVHSCFQKQKPLRKFLMDQHVLRDIKLIYWVTVWIKMKIWLSWQNGLCQILAFFPPCPNFGLFQRRNFDLSKVF